MIEIMKAPSFLLLAILILTLSSAVPGASAQTEDTSSTRKVLNRVQPAYPAIARNFKLTGSVKLSALVTPNGTVKSLQVTGGNPVLAESAKNAVRSWKWEKSEHESTELVEVVFNP